MPSCGRLVEFGVAVTYGLSDAATDDKMLALVTATWNSDKTLPNTLLSVRGLKRGIKHFFVDGGSTDDTLKQLHEYASANSEKIILEQHGLGLYQALNQGVRAAIEDPDVTHIGVLHSITLT